MAHGCDCCFEGGRWCDRLDLGWTIAPDSECPKGCDMAAAGVLCEWQVASHILAERAMTSYRYRSGWTCGMPSTRSKAVFSRIFANAEQVMRAVPPLFLIGTTGRLFWPQCWAEVPGGHDRHSCQRCCPSISRLSHVASQIDFDTAQGRVSYSLKLDMTARCLSSQYHIVAAGWLSADLLMSTLQQDALSRSRSTPTSLHDISPVVVDIAIRCASQPTSIW